MDEQRIRYLIREEIAAALDEVWRQARANGQDVIHTWDLERAIHKVEQRDT